jgi:hypothetical protein
MHQINEDDGEADRDEGDGSAASNAALAAANARGDSDRSDVGGRGRTKAVVRLHLATQNRWRLMPFVLLRV